MKSLILFIFCLIFAINCAPGAENCTKEDLKECIPLEKKLESYASKYKGYRMPEISYNSSIIVCKDIKKCYSDLKCKNAKELKEDVDIKCSKFEYLTAAIHVCSARFYRAVYSKKYECTSKFNFITQDLSAKRSAYQNGKSCFLEVVKQECNPESIEFLNDNEKYGRFVDILTVKPDDKCRGFHHELAALECRPIVSSIEKSIDDLKKNDPKLVASISRCDEALTCVKNACNYPLPYQVDRKCLMLKLATTSLGECESKVHAKWPTVSKYPCLNGTWPMEKKVFCLNKTVAGCFEKSNQSERHGGYIKGESCFLDFVRSDCNQNLFEYFSKNYKQFAETMSIKPKNGICLDPHFQLNGLRCKGFADELNSKKEFIFDNEIFRNDSRFIYVSNLCRELQNCMNESCTYGETATEKIGRECDILELTATSFGRCLSKIRKEKPNISEFECMNGTDFYSGKPSVSCDKFKSRRKCMKRIMRKNCGKEAIEDYRKCADTLSNYFNCN
uniref:DUF19 domain-containing protein n=1 Tax=Caenorhabditis tropicalis TaxID=1561998 RepID=A0A1I7UW55_9PELO